MLMTIIQKKCIGR